MQRDRSPLTGTFRQLVSERQNIPIERRQAALACLSVGNRISGGPGDEELMVVTVADGTATG